MSGTDTSDDTPRYASLENEIGRLRMRFEELAGTSAITATYRCRTCSSLACDHPNGDVKGCKRRKLTEQEYVHSLEAQREALRQVIQILQQAPRTEADNRQLQAENINLTT